MTTLTEFLLARNTEREAVAREATPGPWWNESGTVHAPFPFGRDLSAGPGGACHPLDAQGGNGRDADADAEHAALNDPAHVLAWCETVRRIVACYTETDRSAQAMDYTHGLTDWSPVSVLRDVLCLLALPDAAHPDYDPAWVI